MSEEKRLIGPDAETIFGTPVAVGQGEGGRPYFLELEGRGVEDGTAWRYPLTREGALDLAHRLTIIVGVAALLVFGLVGCSGTAEESLVEAIAGPGPERTRVEVALDPAGVWPGTDFVGTWESGTVYRDFAGDTPSVVVLEGEGSEGVLEVELWGSPGLHLCAELTVGAGPVETVCFRGEWRVEVAL